MSDRGGALTLALILTLPCIAVAAIGQPATEQRAGLRDSFRPIIAFLDSDDYAASVSWGEHVVLVYRNALGRDPTAIEFHYLDRLRDDLELLRSDVLALALQDGEIEPNLPNHEAFLAAYEGPEDFESTPETRRRAAELAATDIVPLLRELRYAPDRPAPAAATSAAIIAIDYQTFFGFLHSHSNLSDGEGGPGKAYTDARASGLDFFALTDHGVHLSLWPWNLRWTLLRSFADAANAPGSFAALWGFEWSNPVLGHVTVVNSPSYTHVLSDLSLGQLFEWLEQSENESVALGRFNHPGEYDHVLGIEFWHLVASDLPPHPQMVGIETWNKDDGFAEYHESVKWNVSKPTYLAQAAAHGWRLGALGAQDNHQEEWGSRNDFRVAVLALELSRSSVLDAYRQRRFYATEELDLELRVRSSGHPMGSELAELPATFEVLFNDPSDEITTLTLFRNGISVDTAAVDAHSGTVTLGDWLPPASGRHSYTVTVETEADTRALSSPIWITDPLFDPIVCATLVPPDLDSPTAEDLSDFNLWMACLGPRYSGTEAHETFLDHIELALDPLLAPDGPMTLDVIEREFDSWQPDPDILPTYELDDGSVEDAAGYYPYSGLTLAGPVEGELVVEKPRRWKGFLQVLNLFERFKFKRSKHEGKIVAVTIPTAKIPKCLLKLLARNSRSDFSDWAAYRRTIGLESQAPCLDQARRAGVKGFVGVLDMSPPHAAEQYLPFARTPDLPVGEGIPAIWVPHESLAALEANNGKTIKIDFPGSVTHCDTTRHLIYTLPGARAGLPDEEIVLIQTHTDGPSALEENGVMALLALAHHFSAMDQSERLRTIVFLFASGHFVQEIEGARDVLWDSPPDWFAKTRVAVAIEHLGATEWLDYASSGYVGRTDGSGSALAEPPLLFVKGKACLETLAHEQLPEERQILIPSRRRFRLAFRRHMFGEGQFVACAGVPTIGYVPNPDYLFSSAGTLGHVEKLDPTRMLVELDAFRELSTALVTQGLGGCLQATPNVSQCREPRDVCH